jgi:hypothetical protein
MAKVVHLPCITSLDIPAERVLSGALENDDPLKDVVIIGWTDEGNFYFASSVADGADVVWLLETAKHKLLHMNGEYEED